MFGFATKKEVEDLQKQINLIRSGGDLDLKGGDDIAQFPSFKELDSEPEEKVTYPTGGDALSIAIRVRAAKDMKKEKKTAKEIANILGVTSGTVRGYWKKRG